jgi:hypothetical protein
MIERRSAPSWARALDAVSVLLAFVAAVVAVSGGFRAHFGGMRVAVTSPLPLLGWCAAIAISRHVAAPQEPLYREFPHRISLWTHNASIRAATLAVIGTRPVMLIVGYLAIFMFGFANGRAPLRHFSNELLNLPVRWDAGWYLQIVTEGYKYTPGDPAIQQNIVFFPAYPMLVRVIGRLFGGDMFGYVAAGMFVSMAAFLGALAYVYAFARDRYGDDVAAAAIWLLAAYPFAIFFGAIYTESLFLLGTVGAIYHFVRQQYVLAACWGLLVGLTRVNGALLVFPLALLALASLPRRPAMSALAAAAAPGIGLLVYALFIWRLTGNPIAFVTSHVAWGREYQGLGTLVAQQYSILASAGLSGYVGAPGYNVLNAIGALFAVATIWPVTRRLGLAYGLFIVINILPPLAAGGLLSAGRFSSVLFPAFVWLATAVPSNHRAAWIATFAAMQAFGAALFYTWRPLF